MNFRFFLFVLMIFSFSFSLFATLEELQKRKEEILREMQSIEQTIEACSFDGDNDDIKAAECIQRDLELIARLNEELDKIKEAIVLHVSLSELSSQKQRLLANKAEEIKTEIREIKRQIRVLNQRLSECLERHIQNSDDDEYQPNQEEDANLIRSQLDATLQAFHLLEEDLRLIEQEIALLQEQEPSAPAARSAPNPANRTATDEDRLPRLRRDSSFSTK